MFNQNGPIYYVVTVIDDPSEETLVFDSLEEAKQQILENGDADTSYSILEARPLGKVEFTIKITGKDGKEI